MFINLYSKRKLLRILQTYMIFQFPSQCCEDERTNLKGFNFPQSKKARNNDCGDTNISLDPYNTAKNGRKNEENIFETRNNIRKIITLDKINNSTASSLSGVNKDDFLIKNDNKAQNKMLNLQTPNIINLDHAVNNFEIEIPNAPKVNTICDHSNHDSLICFPFTVGSNTIDSEYKIIDFTNSMAVYGRILNLNVINTMVNALQFDPSISYQKEQSKNKCNIDYFFCIYNYEFGLCEFCFKILLFMIFFDVDENTNFIKLKKACFEHATNCINLLSNMFYMFYNVETASFASYIHEFTTREQTSAINAVKLTRKCYYENVNYNCNTIAMIDEKIKNISNDNNISVNLYFKMKKQIQKTKQENYTELNKTIFDITEIMYLEGTTHGLLEQLYHEENNKCNIQFNRNQKFLLNYIFLIDTFFYHPKFDFSISKDSYFIYKSKNQVCYRKEKKFTLIFLKFYARINYLDHLTDFYIFLAKIYANEYLDSLEKILPQFCLKRFNEGKGNVYAFRINDKKHVLNVKYFKMYLKKLSDLV